MFRGFLRRYGWRYIPGALLLMLNSYLQTLMPIALGEAIDLLAQETVIRDAVLRQAVAILIIAGSVFVVRFGWRMLIMGNARILERVLREQLYVKLQNMPLSWYHRQRTGDLMAYAVNDINAVRMTFGPAFAMTLAGVATVSFSLFSMGTHVDPLLTTLCMIPIAFAVVAILWIGTLIRERFRRVQEQFASISGRINENISGMRVLKAFVQEALQEKAFEVESEKMRDFNMRLNLVAASLNPLIQFFFGVSFLISVIRGGNLVLSGQMTVGSLVAFNAYLVMIMSPITSIGRIVSLIQRGVASYQRLNGILSAPEIPASEYETGLPLTGNIQVRNLTFRYAGADRNALEGIDLDLTPGKILGVVGPMGCGKSTLLHLLMKFYPAPSGSITIDGKDLGSVSARRMRDWIGFVPQDGFLFDATLRENIAFYRPHTKETEILEAARIASLSHDLEEMPLGLDTMAGERGTHLSGGQRQRASLARAVIRKPGLLLLDDTLSAVDNETEQRIQENLEPILRERSAIIVSHRLSSVRHADEILYMERGRIRERGNHEALMAQGGAYAKLYRQQQREGAQRHA